ncbi:MAG: hypothetical protein AB1847_05690 [bacterium]
MWKGIILYTWKRNKAAAFCFMILLCFMVSLPVSSGQASVIYWGLPPAYSHGPGNFLIGALSNLTARGYGAYAFTDYASAWGLNNQALSGSFLGVGMGPANLNTWGQMYSLSPMYGYNSYLFNNPWSNFSIFPAYTSSYYTFPDYSTLTSPYFPLSTYSPYNLGITDFTQWTTPPLPRLSVPTTTTATTATTAAP